jgi:hypothetical protein
MLAWRKQSTTRNLNEIKSFDNPGRIRSAGPEYQEKDHPPQSTEVGRGDRGVADSSHSDRPCGWEGIDRFLGPLGAQW